MTTIPAVQHSVTVNAPVEKAFKVYTEEFTSWWPPQHHIGTAELAEAVLDVFPSGTGRVSAARPLDASAATLGETLPEAAEEQDAWALAWAERRREARLKQDFKEADRIRDLVSAAGFEIRDTKEGVEVRRR